MIYSWLTKLLQGCALIFFILLGLAIGSTLASAQSFDTAATDSSFFQPPYPLVFVASYRDTNLHYGNDNGGNFGLDVVEVGAPERGQELWILLANGETKKLFPYPSIHQSIVDAPIGPTSGRINGTVTEPSISIDGKRVYFTYFHDALNSTYTPEHSDFYGWSKGADIYVIDLSTILADSSVDPMTLPISRLTQTTNKYIAAMNTGMAQNSGDQSLHQSYGTTYTGALEVDTKDGRKLFFASDRKRLANSNIGMTAKNRNYNIFSADLNFGASVTIDNIRQFQYYTTTSAVSPARLRNGIAYSYQSTTEDNRNWQIQGADSEGKWYPIYGYGTNNELAHLGSLCIKTTPGVIPAGEYFSVVQYYNQNNNGFGHIHIQDMSKVGQNDYKDYYSGSGYVPRQIGSFNITPSVTQGDDPSAAGKFTAPECGRPDELYLTYSPGPANHHYGDYAYPAWIVKTNLDAHLASESPNPYRPVVKSTTADWAAIWPKPVIDWSARLTGTADPEGDAVQQHATGIIDPDTGIAGGLPQAVVGTSALSNTDVTTPECKLSTDYNPHSCDGNCNDRVANNVDNLSFVQNNSPGTPINNLGWCEQPHAANVFGIAIYLTGNKTNNAENNGTLYDPNGGYTTEGYTAGAKETKRLLGVYSVVNQADTSFKALIPANVPVDFQLIHRTYGLKWADVRSWHSFKPRETRHDCGGCHNHRPNEGLDWEGTYASQPEIEPLDMVTKTTYIDYNASCNPVLRVTNTPTVNVPVWQDISAGFDQNCGGCHRNDSTNSLAKSALSYSASSLNQVGGLVSSMAARRYINTQFGALSSPLFWAAYGERTDGRDNTLSSYQPNLSQCSSASPENCGFVYNSVHSTIGARGAGLCDGDPANLATARWVYKLGLWIDNHSPVDTGTSYGFQFDRFHPTIDSALIGDDCSAPQSLVIGFWDDSGTLANVSATARNANLFDPLLNIANGTHIVPASQLNLNQPNTIVRVTAKDAAGNTQSYEKTIAELMRECIISNGGIPRDPFGDGNEGGGVVPEPDDDDDDADNSAPDLGAEVKLKVKRKHISNGEALTFKIKAPTLAGKKITLYLSHHLGTTDLSISGTNHVLNLEVAREKLFNYSKKKFKVTLDQAGKAKISINIPSKFVNGLKFYAQAAGGGEMIYGKSKVVKGITIR